MTYYPTESEKNLAALAQMLAVVGLFLPGWIVSQTKSGRRSPYIRYWAKASSIWSVVVSVSLAGSIAVLLYQAESAPLVLVCVLHVLFCVMGTFGAIGNTRFGYLFIGELFCRWEMSLIWHDPAMHLSPTDDGSEDDDSALLDIEQDGDAEADDRQSVYPK